MRFLRACGNGFVAAFALFVCALEIAGTLPSPILPLLALSVTVPEVAPFALVLAIVVGLVAWRFARGRSRRIALGAVLLASFLALVPLVEFPFAAKAAQSELRGALANLPTARSQRADGPFRFEVLENRRVVLRDGTALGLDVYRSAAPGARPTLVTIYGGAWIFGSRRDTRSIDEAYAARGYTVVAIDYRHAPKFRFPTQVDDVRDALSTIAKHAAEWHVDRDRVALFGRSAGAELALLAAYGPAPVRVRAVVGFYTPTDLIAGYQSPPRPDPADVRAILRAYLGGPPGPPRVEAYRAASPLAHVRTGLPPTLLVVGLRDSLITPDMQRALRDALRARGNRVAAVEIPWSNHAFDNVPGGLGTRIAEPLTREFLAATI